MKRGKFRDNEGFELSGWEKDRTKEKQWGERTFPVINERHVLLKERKDFQGSTVGSPDILVKEKN